MRQLTDTPPEDEQVAMLRKSLRPEYQTLLCTVRTKRMDDFVEAALGVEECLKAGSFTTALASMIGARERKKEHVNYVAGQSSKPKAISLQLPEAQPVPPAQNHKVDRLAAPRARREFS